MKRVLVSLAVFTGSTLLLLSVMALYLLGPVAEERATGIALIISPWSVSLICLIVLLLASLSYWLSGKIA